MNIKSTATTVGNGIVAASGYRPLAAIVNSFVQSLSSTSTDIRAALNTLRRPKSTAPVAPAEMSAAERFEWVQATLELTDADIVQRETIARSRFTFWLFATLAMVVYSILAPSIGLIGHTFIPGAGVALPWMIALLFMLKAVQWSLWSTRLRHRAFVSLKDWVRNPQDWTPWEDKGPGAAATIILAAVGAAAAAYPGTAFAQASSDGMSILTSLTTTLPQTDLGYLFIQRLFPSMFPGSGVSYEQDAVALMFTTFNSVLAALACMRLAFHTVAAMVDVAQEGQVLSQRWHATWAPIRVSLGAASVVPIKGYCLAQLLMMQAVLAGFALANIEWTTYVTAMSGISGTTAVTIPPEASDQVDTFHAVLASEGCYWAMKYETALEFSSGHPGASLTGPGLPGYSTSRPSVALPAPAGALVPKGLNSEQVWDYGTICGRISWPVSTVAAAQDDYNRAAQAEAAMAASNGIDTAYNTVMATPFDSTSASAKATFDTARATALGTFIGTVRSSAMMQAEASLNVGGRDNSGAPNIASLLQQTISAFGTYKSAILTASGTMSTALNGAARKTFLTNAAALGWFSAGALVPEMVRANAEVVQRVSEMPTIQRPDVSSLNAATQKTAIATVKTIEMFLGANTVAGGAVDPAVFAESDIDASIKNPAGMMDRLTGGFTHTVNRLILAQGQLSVLDPIGDLQKLGNDIVWAERAMELTWWGIAAAVGAFQGGAQGGGQALSALPFGLGTIAGLFGAAAQAMAGAASSVLNAMTPMAMTTMQMIKLVAYGYAMVLPMLPFITWIILLVSIMQRIVVSIATASLWAFSHVSMEGKDLFNSGGQMLGIGLFMMKIITPSIALIGLILAQALTSVSVFMVNKMYMLGNETATRGGFLDVYMLIISLIMMMYLHYRVIASAYQLPTKMVDVATQYIEGIDAYRLEGGEGHHEQMGGKVNSVIGGFVNLGGGGKGGGKGGGNQGGGNQDGNNQNIIKAKTDEKQTYGGGAGDAADKGASGKGTTDAGKGTTADKPDA